MKITKPSDLKGKKAIVMGLGIYGGGVASANYLLEHGADVLITDTKKESELKESLDKIKGKVKLVLGEHRENDFKNTDLIIRNPGVPIDSKYLEIARERNIPIEMEITLFCKFCPSSKIVGITGSKGKSTTSTLIYEILKGAGRKVILGGNMGVSVLDQLSSIDSDTFVVLEISSWQIEGLAQFEISPHIGVITNVLREHLNRYASLDDYASTKRDLVRFQRKNDYAVLNWDNLYTRSFGKGLSSKVYYFSAERRSIWSSGDSVELSEDNFKSRKLIGKHNLENIFAAYAVGRILGINAQKILKAVTFFNGLPYRLEVIRKVKGVTFINDTTATMPDATISALNSFNSPIILIAGGNNKDLEFSALSNLINRRGIKTVLLEGTATDILQEKIKPNLLLGRYKDFKRAVLKAFTNAKEGDIVLLSPGATSFATFINEFDRGNKFNQIVNDL